MPLEVYVSIHIPKTVGTDFRTLLAQIPVDALFFSYGANHLGTGFSLCSWPSRIAAAERWGKRVAEIVQDGGNPVVQSLLIHGNFHASKYLPHVPQMHFLSWVRHPVERVTSHYYYWQKNTFPQNKAWREFADSNWSLEEFASKSPYRNLQARYLQGLDPNQMLFLGVIEEHNRSIEELERVFNMKFTILQEAVNANPEREDKPYNLPVDLRSHIEAQNEQDMAIYRAACDRLRVGGAKYL